MKISMLCVIRRWTRLKAYKVVNNRGVSEESYALAWGEKV